MLVEHKILYLQLSYQEQKASKEGTKPVNCNFQWVNMLSRLKIYLPTYCPYMRST